MKNKLIILFIGFISIINGQNRTNSEIIASYNKYNVGDTLKIHMQIRNFGEFDCAGDLDDGRKFNPKNDFSFTGEITEKFLDDSNNWFFKIKIEKMLLKNKLVKKMVILLEEMSVGNEYIFNLWRTEFE